MANKIESFTDVLPAEVKQAYRSLGGDMNLGLRMTKDIRFGEDSKGKRVFNLYRGAGGANDVDFALPSFADVPFEQLAARQRGLASAYPTRLRLTVEQPDSSRLVIGMGQASVYENGFTLHPVFGCPYLPGSSLKGITRRTYIDEYHDGDEGAALADQTFCDLFGCTGDTEVQLEGGKKRTYPSYYKTHGGGEDLGDRRGALVFFDALPTQAPRVVVDILTPHYAPYYKDALPPADIYNPIPVQFLAVEGGRFEVLMGLDAGRGPVAQAADGGERNGFARAMAALRLALEDDGIGGKTTVGYGRFAVVGEPHFKTDDKEVMQREDERRKAAEAERKRVEREAQAEKQRIADEAAAAKAAEAKASSGVLSAEEAEYVPMASLKKRKGGAYRVSVRVATAAPVGSAGKYTFEPLVEELRGKPNKNPIFVNLALAVGEVLTEVEITGVNWKKGIYNISQASIQKR